MNELHKKSEVIDAPKPLSPALQDIKPKSGITLSDAKDFFHSTFEKVGWGGHYASKETREGHTPCKERADWSGPRGDSLATPKEDYISQKDGVSGKEVKEALQKFGLKGIVYKKLEPDFSPCAAASVKIKHMSKDLYPNVKQADAALAKQWNKENHNGRSNWTPSEFREYRRKHKLTWHERCDMKTMDLVPTIIHKYFGHTGGRDECDKKSKLENSKRGQIAGGKFDD